MIKLDAADRLRGSGQVHERRDNARLSSREEEEEEEEEGEELTDVRQLSRSIDQTFPESRTSVDSAAPMWKPNSSLFF